MSSFKLISVFSVLPSWMGSQIPPAVHCKYCVKLLLGHALLHLHLTITIFDNFYLKIKILILPLLATILLTFFGIVNSIIYFYLSKNTLTLKHDCSWDSQNSNNNFLTKITKNRHSAPTNND